MNNLNGVREKRSPTCWTRFTCGVVVLAASAGGIDALCSVLAALPADLQASVLIVQHRASEWPGHLAEIFSRRSVLPVKDGDDGESLRTGQVYVAPRGRHLIVTGERLQHWQGPKVKFSRPAADPLFESAAAAFLSRTIAVVLTGYDHDGSDGIRAVKKANGFVIVQDPDAALVPSMPVSAVRTGAVDLILPLEEIGATVWRLVGEWAAV